MAYARPLLLLPAGLPVHPCELPTSPRPWQRPPLKPVYMRPPPNRFPKVGQWTEPARCVLHSQPPTLSKASHTAHAWLLVHGGERGIGGLHCDDLYAHTRKCDDLCVQRTPHLAHVLPGLPTSGQPLRPLLSLLPASSAPHARADRSWRIKVLAAMTAAGQGSMLPLLRQWQTETNGRLPARTHTRARAHTHTHAHARTHTHMHTHTHTHTHTQTEVLCLYNPKITTTITTTTTTIMNII